MLKAVVIISGIIILIIGYFIYAIVKRQREVMRWQQARIKAEIEILETERKRIAGDLHDELGPMLSAIKLQINHLEPADDTETAVLEKSSGQIDHVIQRFRDISYNLLPNTLVRKGFIKATEEFIGKMKPLHPLNITFKSVEFSIAPEKEVSLYRIIQEIIQNTIKHARATRLDIGIHKKIGHIFLVTKDDGIGFNYVEKSNLATGVGLLSLQSRVELLGGRLLVHTQPGAGTLFEIEIPV